MGFSQKKTIYKVIIVHFLVIVFFYFSTKISIRSPQYKSIAVKEMVIKEEEKKAPVIYRSPQKKIVTAKKASVPRRPNAQARALLQKMRSTLNNMESKPEKPQEQPLFVPHKVENTIKSPAQQISTDSSFSYVQRLIEELQNHLNLPEYGEVKVEMTITQEGMITDLYIVDAQSEKNAAYLKKTLPNVTFPWFNQYAKQEKVRVLFRNER